MAFKPGHKTRPNGKLGKVRSLPLDIRNEVSHRIDQGLFVEEIVAWLNAHEEVRKILAKRWQNQPVNRNAIYRWRNTGYQEWLRNHQQVENLKELSEYALKLGQAAGGSLADGSAAIAGGRIMAALETTSDDDIHKMVRSISELRSGDFKKVQLRQHDRRLAQQDQKLDLERKRYQRQTAESFIAWYEDKRAREIVESRDSNAEKLEKLGRAMFGEDW